ncbi:calpain-5-like, partial [Centruroides sculpturatus]|uniref:calpain-5-like n=1 Tax=Centruroides sculpturatus TaxID=218467 RepID=UPI000C6D3F9F
NCLFFTAADPYCIVKCEGERIRTPICHDTLDPIWNVSAIFYRKSVDSPIKIQVWNSNIIMDTYLGKGALTVPITTEPVIHEIELFGRKGEGGVKKPGTLVVEVITSDDLMTF